VAEQQLPGLPKPIRVVRANSYGGSVRIGSGARASDQHRGS